MAAPNILCLDLKHDKMAEVIQAGRDHGLPTYTQVTSINNYNSYHNCNFFNSVIDCLIFNNLLFSISEMYLLNQTIINDRLVVFGGVHCPGGYLSLGFDFFRGHQILRPRDEFQVVSLGLPQIKEFPILDIRYLLHCTTAHELTYIC